MTAETILDLFEPPDGRVAHSVALVAMTGTRDLLEDALIRFTGLKARQRAELGMTNAYLMLDAQSSSGRSGVFGPQEIPGLHELQPRDLPSALLHSKVALLAFAKARLGEPTDLRLAILTANFTYASAKQQLELAWAVDIALDAPAPADERADLAAAAAFIGELIARRFHLAERALPTKQRAITGRLDTLLKTCRALEPERTKARFIHSLDEPLLPQIRQQMRRLRTSASRNFLLCGSGFFEDPGPKAAKPTVLAELEKLGGFTDRARRVAIAEPKMAGALAPWAKTGADEGWELMPPVDPLGRGRALHAKFIYTGWLREGVASNGCLYIGSGNLSRRGLLSAEVDSPKRARKGHDGVNIECGVVLIVDERLNAEALAERLFWVDREEATDFDEWEPGTEEDEEQVPILASPILLARVTSRSELALEWREDLGDSSAPLSLWLGAKWIEVRAGQAAVEVAAEDRLDVLRVRDAARGHEWTVPIVDAIGRVCWTPPRFNTYEEALEALLDFPIRPAESSGEDDEADGGDGEQSDNARREDDHVKSYALHAAAELIEQMAALQSSLPPEMLDDWLDHIERFFHGSFPPALIETWRTHRIDVLGHLAQPDLRPPSLTVRQRERYGAILDAIARTWGQL